MKLAILEILEILQKIVTTKTSTLSYDVLQEEIFASEESYSTTFPRKHDCGTVTPSMQGNNNSINAPLLNAPSNINAIWTKSNKRPGVIRYSTLSNTPPPLNNF